MSDLNVLFVCLGNICRSPLAEGVFIHQVEEAGLSERIAVDSAGTGGYHTGERADPRSREVAERHGVDLPSRARKVRDSDFVEFTHVVAMDAQNKRDLLARCPGEHEGKVFLLRDHDPDGPGDVPDPYYGGPKGFDLIYDQVERSCRQLLSTLSSELG